MKTAPHRIFGLLLLLGMMACDPPQNAPNVGMRGADNQIRPLGMPGDKTHQDDADDVRRMVNESTVTHEGEELTVEEWIQRITDVPDGQVMFPRWTVRRRGANQYEVSFTFTVIRQDYTIRKQGYSWRVDPVLRLIGSPVEIAPQEMARESGLRHRTGAPGEEDEPLFRLE